jgi:hypothetical protein
LSPSLCQDYDNIDYRCTWKEVKLYNSKVVKILFNEHYMGIIMTHYMELHCFIIGFDWLDLNFKLNKKLCHPYSILKSVLMVSIFIGAFEIARQQLNIEHVNQRNINIFLLVLLNRINWNAWWFPSCDFWFRGLEPMQVEHVYYNSNYNSILSAFTSNFK